jgi:hypothetical protein
MNNYSKTVSATLQIWRQRGKPNILSAWIHLHHLQAFWSFVESSQKIGMEHWWNDTDSRTLNYWKKNPSQCHLAHHSHYTDRPGIELGPQCSGRRLWKPRIEPCLRQQFVLNAVRCQGVLTAPIEQFSLTANASVNFVMFVRQSTCSNSAPTGGIFEEILRWDLPPKSVDRTQFGENLTKLRDSLHKCLSK